MENLIQYLLHFYYQVNIDKTFILINAAPTCEENFPRNHFEKTTQKSYWIILFGQFY